MNYYLPGHTVTANYLAGMRAIGDSHLADAIDLLAQEPTGSPCYGLAMANKALAEIQLERFSDAEASARMAIKNFEEKGSPHPPTWIQAYRNAAEAIGRQERLIESIPLLNRGCSVADALVKDHPGFKRECEIEKAHVYNSWGGALLRTYHFKPAVEILGHGRKLYRQYPENRIGLAETLINLAQAYGELGKKTEAALALQEAETFAESERLHQQQIKGIRARLGLLDKEETIQHFWDTGAKAVADGLMESAYTQYCIAAMLADKAKNPTWGMEAVRRALEIEGSLPAGSLYPPKLRFYQTAFAEMQGRPQDEILAILLEGAKLWSDRLPGPLSFWDYNAAVEMMHGQFRKLSSQLVQMGRNEEAFIAFEMGRARGYAAEIAGRLLGPTLTVNPFHETEVDCSLLRQLQENLAAESVLISVAILAPTITAFIISKEKVAIAQVLLASGIEEASRFGEALRTLDEALHAGKGLAAIPVCLQSLSLQMAAQIGQRTVVALCPHTLLHEVPWRILLRESGVEWPQLPFITQFSALLDPGHPMPDAFVGKEAVALGSGTVGTKSLEDEAREFAEAFGSEGKFERATRSRVTAALGSSRIVLLSCHGSAVSNENGETFTLTLEDGSFTPEELLGGAAASIPLLLLSACESGVYQLTAADYPAGAATDFLLAGVKFCVCTRFSIMVDFAKSFVVKFGSLLASGLSVGVSFARAMQAMEEEHYDRWRFLVCLELLGR